MKKKKQWTMPLWMEPFRATVADGDRIEEFMNCTGVNCNILVNGPRALCCVSTTAQVELLVRLHNQGKI